MKSSRHFTFGVLSTFLGLLALLVSACGGSSGTPASSTPSAAKAAPADQQVFRYRIVSDIGTFDPALDQDTDSAAAIQLVFTGLVSQTNDLEVVPQLAASYSLSSDRLEYTFKLKPNLKFSDGSPLTSQDVVYSLNRTIDPKTKSPVSNYLSLIKDYDQLQAGKIPTLIGDSLLAPDPNTVVIKLSKPAAYFLESLTYPTSYVVEKKLIDTYGAQWTDHLTTGGGDGPFKVQTYSHTTGITFVPNPNYYGAKPKLQKIQFLIFDSADTNYQAYQAKQVDITIVPPQNLATAKSMPGFINVPQLTTIYFALNYLTKPFDNIHIRQAFALAINKDLLAQSIYKGAYTATNHIVPQGMPGYNPALTGPAGSTTAGDAAKAKQLFQQGLQEEGYKSVADLPKLNFTYYAAAQSTKQFVTAIIQMWNTTLGINVQQQTLDFNKLSDLTDSSANNPKGLQMWRAAWVADYPDPQDWTSLFFQKGADQNSFNYGQNNSSTAAEQQQVQQQLAAADVNPDNTARMKAYNTAEQALVNDVALIPIFQAASQYIINPKLHGLVINAEGSFPPDSWANVYMTA
ncbi:MAG TPA: peptide ABC transporter substrate-binding protein [Ktedonobacteraceae bacterium]|jgi:oligopeptide transport system substrate-binding protein|nr:peptide ABC transporter substrate-binding protein [Ktedonobacteraceae bacterium]